MMSGRVAEHDSDIALAGLWHLGSVAAAAWTATGSIVNAWDPDAGLRRDLSAGRGTVVEQFATTARPGSLLLVSSQLPAGTCRDWAARLVAEDRGLLLAHAPENLRLSLIHI